MVKPPLPIIKNNEILEPRAVALLGYPSAYLI